MAVSSTYRLSKVKPVVLCDFCGATYVRQGELERAHGWYHVIPQYKGKSSYITVPNWWSFVSNCKPQPSFRSKRKLK